MTDWQHKLVKTETLDVEALLQMAHPENAREHPDHQLEATEELIETIGLIDEIKVNINTKRVFNGHARIQLALRSGKTSLPVNWYDLTEDEERLALEQYDATTYEATYNPDKLRALMEKTKGIKADRPALQALMERLKAREGIDENGESPKDDPGAQIDKAAQLQEKWGTATGQVWALGEHRVGCLDSTNERSIAQLFDGRKASLFATDPPYGANAGNIGFTAQRDDIEAITKDDLEGLEMQAFLESVFRVWIPYLTVNCAWYLWHPMLTQGYFAAAAAAADLVIHRQIIWRKDQFIFGRGDYHWRHELCFYGWRKGNRPNWYAERNQDTVWDIPYDVKRSEIGHPTTKPVELFSRPIHNHTQQGEVCAEPFLGSGSQLIACEQSERVCIGADVEPKYIAVTIQRWVDLTNQEPTLLNT